MEIYVGNRIHSNLLDSFTRKYNELLYIIAEMETIYNSLDDELRATALIQDLFRALKSEMDELGLGLKRRTEYLADAEAEYQATERSIIRKIEELLPDRLFNNTMRPHATASESVYNSSSMFSELGLSAVPFCYIPKSVSDDIERVTRVSENVEGGQNNAIINVIWDDDYDANVRDYDTYKCIVTRPAAEADMSKQQTQDDYVRNVFEKLELEYPGSMNESMTDYGWYLTTGEDAALMAEEGYPALICDQSGFVGMALCSGGAGTVKAHNETGEISVKMNQSLYFYVHR